MRQAPFSEAAARQAIANGLCWSDALRALGYRPVGHNIRTLQRWAKRWRIPTEHFDPNMARRRAKAMHAVPLERILIEGSTYSRGHLKRRLYEEGVKERRCEMCGQDEEWRGRRMSLILDHVNGRAQDHRLENLRIVCPNCAATLDTHCGRNVLLVRACVRCGTTFRASHKQQRHCSRRCGASSGARGAAKIAARRVERPPYQRLLAEIKELGYLAVGRRYGVSDNAIRKWVRQYERERLVRDETDAVRPELSP